MLPKTLAKNPIFMIGVLMMSIFLMNLGRQGFFKSFREKRTPDSCKAALVKLDRRIPANWSTKCEKGNMAITVMYNNDSFTLKKPSDLKSYLYRDLANNLILIAKNAPSDNMEFVDIIRLNISHPDLTLNAVTQGKYITKLATIKSKKFLQDHLKSTVYVQEIKK